MSTDSNGTDLLQRLRSKTGYEFEGDTFGDRCVSQAFEQSSVAFVSGWSGLETVFDAAVTALARCIRDRGGVAMLQEGGVYDGCWLESTATANAEVLSRFVPDVAESTMLAFAEHQRADGLIPYKISEAGPVYHQIQLVTPPVRSAWHHYRVAGANREDFLSRIYESYVAYDRWLGSARNTRGTGCVEAFCAFDTGHDLSPRFWHVPDSPYDGDPTRYDPDNPRLPFISPDLTATAACSRDYLARIQTEIDTSGGDPGADSRTETWTTAGERMREALRAHCFDEKDAFFYDRDARGEFVRIQSDVLLRVLASEAVSPELFEQLLSRYILNTRKFYSNTPFTSIALDDPRFFQSSSHNSWAGAVNFLTVIRAPHMFEHYGHPAEFMTAANQLMQAFAELSKFPQCLNPWTGEAGFTELYSPAILSVLDYIERMHGIQLATDGTLWCNARPAVPATAGTASNRRSAYRRVVGGATFELVCGNTQAELYRDGRLHAAFPVGTRLMTTRSGRVSAITGLVPRTVSGVVRVFPDERDGGEEHRYEVSVSANETVTLPSPGSREPAKRTSRRPYIPPQF